MDIDDIFVGERGECIFNIIAEFVYFVVCVVSLKFKNLTHTTYMYFLRK